MQDKIFHIYDKTFKKVLTLSSKAVINMINGLFDTNYPADSTITYNWTEFEDDRLRKILADTIITINGHYSYHIEAQIEKDDDIVFRVFEYGFAHANRSHTYTNGTYVLKFPTPVIIYLDHSGKVPSEYDLLLDFGDQGSFCYHSPVVDFQSISMEELNDRKLVILIPFHLLKLRRLMKQERSEENKQALLHLINDDIIGSINKNLKAGNITIDDARKLSSYTQTLYHHIYAHYEELEEISDMTDESFMTEVDILCEEKERLQALLDATILEKESVIAKKDSAIAEKDSEIEALKKQLSELQAKFSQ
jgi:hypothetical protein